MIQQESIKYFNIVKLTIDFFPLRIHFVAAARIQFPAGSPGNVIRGAFGILLRQAARPEDYARIFAPKSQAGPSGLADPPRPFVFRARHLDGSVIGPGEPFHVDMNVFTSPELFADAFARWDRATLLRVNCPPEPRRLSLDAPPAQADRVRVDFLSPTELKDRDGIARRPEFPILFGRIRDRLSTLSALYGSGPLVIDFAAMGQRAARVRLACCDIRPLAAERRSTRTGQTHPLGGFIGWAEYEGELAEFLPYLEAARWTGVGRQTVWGKGEISVQALSSAQPQPDPDRLWPDRNSDSSPA